MRLAVRRSGSRITGPIISRTSETPASAIPALPGVVAVATSLVRNSRIPSIPSRIPNTNTQLPYTSSLVVGSAMRFRYHWTIVSGLVRSL
jgi:hypothetical protein